jgi:hypothetical protein
MQGCARPWLALLLLAPVGCSETAAPEEPAPSFAEQMGTAFDAGTTGAIRGRVVWRGEVPRIPPFQVHAYLDYIIANQIRGEQPNPHVPAIDPDTRGVGQVAIRLGEVAPSRAKPWDHAPVRVLMRRRHLTLAQAREAQPIAFVPRGGEIICVNHDIEYHTLHVRGAAFFTLPFVDAERPTRRRLGKPGLVELSCGAGHFWMRAYLFVLEHPYAALTDADGTFTLEQVPAGTYQLTAWQPNWHVLSRERDPETGLISRIVFAPPVELDQTVTVIAGETVEATFELVPELFDVKKNAASSDR